MEPRISWNCFVISAVCLVFNAVDIQAKIEVSSPCGFYSGTRLGSGIAPVVFSCLEHVQKHVGNAAMRKSSLKTLFIQCNCCIVATTRDSGSGKIFFVKPERRIFLIVVFSVPAIRFC